MSNLEVENSKKWKSETQDIPQKCLSSSDSFAASVSQKDVHSKVRNKRTHKKKDQPKKVDQ